MGAEYGMRDLKITDDVGQMYRLGRFDREFALYGFACLYERQSYYIISAKPEKIADLVEKCHRAGCYPTAVKELHENRQVPSGTREAIAQSLKLDLARRMQAAYPRAFLLELEETARIVRTDEARPLLYALKEQLEGVFDKKQLELFEGLLVRAYSSALLTEKTYQMFKVWLDRERTDLQDDVVVQDMLEQVFYGLAYEKDSGHWAYQINAHREVLYKQQFECWQQGKAVTPLWAEACGYNYQYRLADAREDFGRRLRQVYDETYLSVLLRLSKRSQMPMESTLIRQKIDETLSVYGQEAAELLRYYAYRWSIF